MKFNQYLEQNAVEEWRRAYINYRGLKKLIKRVAAHHRQRLELLAKEYDADAPRQEATPSASKSPTKESLASLRARVAHAQQQDGSASDLAASPRPPYEVDAVTLAGTGLSLSSTSQAKLRPRASGSDGNEGDVEQGVAAPSLSALTAAGGSHHKKKTKKHRQQPQPTQLDEYLSTLFDPSEQLFFHVLDSELERITDFYQKELAEAQTRFNALAQQLNELAEHRRTYKEAQIQGADPFDWKRVLKGKGKAADQPQTEKRRPAPLDDHQGRANGSSEDTAIDERSESVQVVKSVSSDEDPGAKRRSVALERMQRLAPHRGEDTGEGHASQVRHPERYKAARHKLKDAIAESYRGLELLRTYASVLNKTGFAKILKKFDKRLETQTSQRYWKARIESSPLSKSKAIDDLIRSTEDAFATFFEHGDRKRALERLRAQGQVASALRTHHGAASRTGFFLGITLCAVVGGLVEAMKPERQQGIPSYQALLRVYGALFLPVLFLILWGVNLAAFAHNRVSTLFIFEWNPKTALDYHEYPELPSFLLLILAIFFWVSFVNPFPSAIAPTTWPLVWLVVALVVWLLPLPIIHLRSRTWFIRSILRVFGAGFLVSGTVEFRDFFLGDELNSIAWSISTLWFIGCEYQRKWHEPQCEPNGTYWTAALSSLPALLRFAQCLRRWTDSKFYARVHLLNATKYSTTVAFYFTYLNWRKGGSLPLWIVFACLYSSTTMSWDILMDWSLLHPHAKYPFLRDELLFESYWPVYYWAIFSNVILRCSWIIYLLPGSASTLMRTFIVALLEVLRRWQWNFFRIANEHQQNVEQYRALRDTPLPYTVPKARADDEGSDDGHEQPSNVALRLRTWGRAMRPSHAPKPANESTSPQAPAQPTAQPAAQSSTSSSLLARVQTFLVPDHGGWAARGHRLDEEAAVTGSMGRDYMPRPRESAADSDSDGGSESNDADSEVIEDPASATSGDDQDRVRSADA